MKAANLIAKVMLKDAPQSFNPAKWMVKYRGMILWP